MPGIGGREEESAFDGGSKKYRALCMTRAWNVHNTCLRSAQKNSVQNLGVVVNCPETREMTARTVLSLPAQN